MLHPRPRRPRRRGRHLRLSVTLDTMPISLDYVVHRVRRTTHPAHYLVIARDGITYDELSHAYARDRDAEWMRPRIFGPLGIVDPAVDLDAYHRTRWWGLDWPLTTTILPALEEVASDGITPWRHDWLLDPPA